MFLLVAVLNSDAHVRKVLEGFTAIDVGGATVIDSRGMGQMLAADIPVVASIGRLLEGSPVQESSKIIFSVISSLDALERAKEIVLGAVGDMTQKGVGILFVVPVTEAYGLIKPEVPKTETP
jgi:nitrogen regulatory protein P-II 1